LIHFYKRMFWVAVPTVALLWLTKYYVSNRKWFILPNPGPCLPLFGHFFKLLAIKEFETDPVRAMWNMWKKNQQGGMFWMRTFSMNLVFVGDHDTLHYLFNHPDVQGRFDPKFSSVLKMERELREDQVAAGVILSEGKTWQEQRRFTLRTLRDFGFGKAGMEGLINEEVAMFIEEVKKSKGEPFDFVSKFNLPILNALWNITAGQRFDYNDPKLTSLIQRMTEWFKRVAAPTAVLQLCFPIVFKIFPKLFNYHETVGIQHDVLELIRKNVDEHEQTIDHNEPRDFTDKTLTEISKTSDPSSSFHGESGRLNLVHTLFDIFLAGSETTSTTLTWAMLYMGRYPEVQAKVHKELDQVVGEGRVPSLDDKPNLPYTEAVVMEIQRYASIVPQGVSHTVTKEVTVNGFTLPKDAMVVPLMKELLQGSYWGDGETFRPERFLDSDGKCKKDDHLIPFSIGKRQCLGETLAKAELFLFFTGILQQFEIKPEVDGEFPSEDYDNGVTVLPKPFKLRLHSRMES